MNHPYLGDIRTISKEIITEALLYGIIVDEARLLSQATGTPLKYTQKRKNKLYYSNPEIYQLYGIKTIYENPSKTMKLLVLEDEKIFFMSDREIRESWRGIDIGDKTASYYSLIKEGMRVLTGAGSRMEVAHYIIDIPDLDVDKVLTFWDEVCCEDYHAEFPTVLTQDIIFKTYRKWRINSDYKKFLELLTDKEKIEALNQHFHLILKERKTAEPRATKFMSLKLHALDNNDYFLECETTGLSDGRYNSPHIIEMKSLEEVVYGENGDSKDYVHSKIERCLSDLVRHWNYFKFGINNKIVSIVVKTTPDKTKDTSIIRRFYINDVFCPQDMIVSLLMQLQDKSINEVLKQTKIVKDVPTEAQLMLNSGLKGQFFDLQGYHSFNMNVKRMGRSYVLELHGKEYPIKGGFNALEPLKASLNGKSYNSSEMREIGANSSKDFRWILFKLSELIGKENALEILIEMKKELAVKEEN